MGFFGALPPEINSTLMYTGAGAGPLLASASAWDGLAAELHSAQAAYNSVITGLTSDGWMGPASKLMATAAAPYAAWMGTTAVLAEQTAGQIRAAVTAYEGAHAATVPPAAVAANRTQQATLVATNILGQNTPLIAAVDAIYAEFWAQDATAMDVYFNASTHASTLGKFSDPPKTTNPAGLSNQAAATGQAGATAAATHAQTIASSAPSLSAAPTTTPISDLGASGSSAPIVSPQQALSYATMVPQNGSYLFSLANSLNSLGRAFSGAGGAAAAASGVSSVAPALSGVGGIGSLASASSAGSALTAGLGQSGTIGGLSVPQAWASATPVTNATLASATSLSGTPGIGANPGAGMMNGMPMLANAARAAAGGGQAGVMPRFDLRPSVIPMSPAAG